MQSFQGLHARFFVGADDVNALPMQFRRLLVEVTQDLNLGGEIRIVFRRVQPMMDLMRLEFGLILKKRALLHGRWR
jgi:hypothetical protein